MLDNRLEPEYEKELYAMEDYDDSAIDEDFCDYDAFIDRALLAIERR